MVRRAALTLALAGCRPSGGSPTPTEATPATGTPTSPTTEAESSDTGADPTTTTTRAACDDLPDAPLSVTTYPIETTEDFDFDAAGWLIYATSGALLGVDIGGRERLVALGLGSYLRGIQVLSTGDLVVADFNVGRVEHVDGVTGAVTTLTSALAAPNGLEVGEGDVIYVSDAGLAPAVRVVDLDGGPLPPVPVGAMTYPNGIALDEAEETLYVADGRNGVFVSRRAVDGDWSVAERLFDPDGGEFNAVEVDTCGNVYALDFRSGRLYRYDPGVDATTLLVDLDDPDGWLWNSIRWGSDRGGWRRDVLYVTDRHQLFGVELGVRGRSQPIDP